MDSIGSRASHIVIEPPAPKGVPPELREDPRWQLIERIIDSEPFQKSTRLPALLRHLAILTLTDDRKHLNEQAIGRDVFGKASDYTPAEDSSVRVYVRQLRLRLHEYYDGAGREETCVVSIPKGGYTLAFSQPSSPSVPLSSGVAAQEKEESLPSQKPSINSKWYLFAIVLLVILSVTGWYRAMFPRQASMPWPISLVVRDNTSTTLVLADAGFALRLLGNNEVPLDAYIDHSYLPRLLPKNMTEGEASVIHYFDNTRLTSIADAHAVSALTFLSASYGDRLVIRSARDINANDLTNGDFVFIGSKTSNPWVGLFESNMNFQIIETAPHGERYVLNRKPLPGEQSVYKTKTMGTLASGEDYAVIACVPSKGGKGNTLILEGVRMEGSEAAIALLRNRNGERSRLEKKLASANGGQAPTHFEALIHAQSVAGATISVEIEAVRVLP